MPTLPWLLTALVTLAGAARVSLVFADLPERIASHFGPSGAADSWMAKGTFVAFLAGTDALVLGAIALALVVPGQLLAVPHRDHWLANRVALRQKLLWWTGIFALITQVHLGAMLELTLQVGLEGAEQLPMGPFWAGMGVYSVVIAAALVGFVRSFRLPG